MSHWIVALSLPYPPKLSRTHRFPWSRSSSCGEGFVRASSSRSGESVRDGSRSLGESLGWKISADFPLDDHSNIAGTLRNKSARLGAPYSALYKAGFPSPPLPSTHSRFNDHLHSGVSTCEQTFRPATIALRSTAPSSVIAFELRQSSALCRATSPGATRAGRSFLNGISVRGSFHSVPINLAERLTPQRISNALGNTRGRLCFVPRGTTPSEAVQPPAGDGPLQPPRSGEANNDLLSTARAIRCRVPHPLRPSVQSGNPGLNGVNCRLHRPCSLDGPGRCSWQRHRIQFLGLCYVN